MVVIVPCGGTDKRAYRVARRLRVGTFYDDSERNAIAQMELSFNEVVSLVMPSRSTRYCLAPQSTRVSYFLHLQTVLSHVSQVFAFSSSLIEWDIFLSSS